MPRTHDTTATLAALLLAATGVGGAAHAFINLGRLGPPPEASGEFCSAPAAPFSLLCSLRGETSGSAPAPDKHPSGGNTWAGDALHGCSSVDIAARANRSALIFLKKKIKKKSKPHGKAVDRPAVHVTRVSTMDVDPQKVSPRTHPAMTLLRTVVLLA